MPPGRLRKPLWEISGRAGYFSADCGDWTARGLRNPPRMQEPGVSPRLRPPRSGCALLMAVTGNKMPTTARVTTTPSSPVQ